MRRHIPAAAVFEQRRFRKVFWLRPCILNKNTLEFKNTLETQPASITQFERPARSSTDHPSDVKPKDS